jgi:hypothetical protein
MNPKNNSSLGCLLEFPIGVGLTWALIFGPLILFGPFSGTLPAFIGLACVFIGAIYFAKTRYYIALGMAAMLLLITLVTLFGPIVSRLLMPMNY